MSDPVALPRLRQVPSLAIGITAWIIACVGLTYAMMAYDFTPGRTGPQPSTWPTGLSAAFSPLAPRKMTVVAFVHPRCVCSRATVNQLLRVALAHPEADVIAGMFTPTDAAGQKGWEDSEYAQSIRAALPQAKLVFDRAGQDAQRFGAYTSGTILVYNAQGHELFRGGITDRRGGEEDNPGLRQLTSTLAFRTPQQDKATPVYGCPIVTPGRVERAGETS